MKIIAIYSTMTGNTLKLIRGIKGIKFLKPSKNAIKEIKKSDLVIFASGIYAWRHHKDLLKFAENIPAMKKKTLIISTAGSPALSKIMHFALRRRLKKKGFKILGEFSCPGLDNFGPLKLFGGINKGHPDRDDLKKAAEFLKQYLK